MSAHVDSITNHAVFGQIDVVQSTIAEILSENSILDENNKDILMRANLVIENLKQSLSASDKDLVSLTWLTEANNALTQIASQVNSYKSNHNVGHITNVNPQIDSILNATSKINLIKSRQNFNASSKALQEHSETINSVIDVLGKKLNEAKILVSNLEGRNEEFEKKIDNKLSEVNDAINTEKARLDQLAMTHQSKMIEDQEKYSKALLADNEKFLNELTTYRNEIAALQKEIISANEETHAKFIAKMDLLSENADKLIASTQSDFDNYKDKVESIVGVLSNNMFAHKYKEVADNSHKSARTWHIIATILMLGVAAFAVYAFVITTNQDSDWVRLVAKIFATTTMATGAAYAARQASKQEKVERYYRKVESELLAFDPFINSLSEELQSELKSEIAKRIFGNNDTLEIKDSDEAHHALDKAVSLEDLIKTFVSIIGKK